MDSWTHYLWRVEEEGLDRDGSRRLLISYLRLFRLRLTIGSRLSPSFESEIFAITGGCRFEWPRGEYRWGIDLDVFAFTRCMYGGWVTFNLKSADRPHFLKKISDRVILRGTNNQLSFPLPLSPLSLTTWRINYGLRYEIYRIYEIFFFFFCRKFFIKVRNAIFVEEYSSSPSFFFFFLLFFVLMSTRYTDFGERSVMYANYKYRSINRLANNR